MKILYIIFITILSIIPMGCSFFLTQGDYSSYPPWAFQDTDHFRLIMDEKLKSTLLDESPTQDHYIINVEFNEKSYPFSIVNLHGQSSLNYNRRSFEIKTRKEDPVEIGASAYDEFFLISMDRDKGYINHIFAYTMLKKLDLFYPAFSLSEVIINTETLGLYMFVEKTQDTVVKNIPNVDFVLRRRMGMNYSVLYYTPYYSHLSLPEYRKIYESIYSKKNIFSGRTLYEELAKIMNIQKYMYWLAFNTFAKNGDYTDEIFFFGRPEIEDNQIQGVYFDISAWDYDDLFKEPHYGNDIPNSLVYCGENILDITIAEDTFLYTKFLEYFLSLLENLITSSYIDEVFASAELSLYPFLSRDDILSIQFNLEGPVEWSTFTDYYNDRRNFLQTRRNELLTTIRRELGIIP